MNRTFQKKNLRKFVFSSFLSPGLAIILVIAFSLGVSAKETEKVAVLGTLYKVVLIQGNTTGWIVELSREEKIFGYFINELDLDPKNQSIEKYIGKQVMITGDVLTRIGEERGNYPVIELETIQLSGTR